VLGAERITRLIRDTEGVAREVAALYGERPPPVAVYEEKKAYRAKRQTTGPVKKWWVVFRWGITRELEADNTVCIGFRSRSSIPHVQTVWC
jgi:hypothetical protein